MADSPKVIVIGAGIIGLSIAWQLARRGASVTILERGEPAKEASWAAAGMLLPFGENPNSEPMTEFAAESLRLYPQFLAAIAEDCGDPPELSGPGMIHLALTEEDVAERKYTIHLMQMLGFPATWLTSAEVHNLEPALSKACLGGLLSTAETHIDPRLLCASLGRAASNRGVNVLPFTEVCDWEIHGDSVTGVRAAGVTMSADLYIIAAGAYSARLGARLGSNLPVSPRKGQIIAIDFPSGPLPIQHNIYTVGSYLVPRGNRLIIGATVEDAGFDKAVTEPSSKRLLDNAIDILPNLAGATVTDAWTGLRPATPGNKPIIGLVPGHPNIYAATGHYRNGILLAPATAYAVADEILTSASIMSLDAFRPARFQSIYTSCLISS